MNAEKPVDWENVGGKDFDSYDIWSFMYGWIVGMQDQLNNGEGASECFFAAYSLVQTCDLWYSDLVLIESSRNVYNVIVYTPVHIFNNFGATYE